MPTKSALSPIETARARKAFAAYLDMDPEERSLEKAASLVGVHAVTVRTWSSRYKWNERARAYDTALAEQSADRAREEGQRDALKRQKERYRRADLLLARGSKYIYDHEVKDMNTDKGRLALALVKYGEERHLFEDGLLKQEETGQKQGETFTIKIIREAEESPEQNTLINVTPQENQDFSPSPLLSFSREEIVSPVLEGQLSQDS